MTMLPDDLTSRVGREDSARQIFSAAWRAHRSSFRRAVLLAMTPVAALILLTVVGYGVAAMGADMADDPPWLVIVFVIPGIAIICVGPAFVLPPVMAGYWWSAVKAFEGRRLTMPSLMAGFRLRYKTLLGLSLLEYVCMVIPAVAVQALFVFIMMGIFTGKVAGGPILAAFAYLGMLPAVGLVLLAVHFFFYLAPLFVMEDEHATVRSSLRNTWHVIRERPKQYFGIYLFPLVGWAPAAVAWFIALYMGLMLVAAMAFSFGGNREQAVLTAMLLVGILGMLVLLAATLWWIAFTGFLKAAFFRSVSGYGLSVEPGGRSGFAPIRAVGEGDQENDVVPLHRAETPGPAEPSAEAAPGEQPGTNDGERGA